MNFGIVIGASAVTVSVLATTAIIARRSGFYRQELASGPGRRELPLDGLRGFAALMVVTHHSALFRNWLTTGKWGDAGNPVLQAFGPAGVILFFMLTGYLFWGKARAGNGKVGVRKLWRGRLFRIGPLYVFTVVLIMTIAIATYGMHFLNLRNWEPLVRVGGLGFFLWRPIADIDIGQLNARVTWTLWYEWRFYLLLPFIAWFAAGRRVFWLAIASYIGVIVAGYYGVESRIELGLVFFLGMFCPVFLENEKLRGQLRSPLAAGGAVLAMACLLALYQAYPSMVSFGVAFFPIFLVAAAGNTLGGVLTSLMARCLGSISYSLYLLHGILFYLAMNVFKSAGRVSLPEVYYWATLVGTAAAAALLSALTYRWVEFPFLSRSHRAAVTTARTVASVSIPAPVREQFSK
jgi:peptidoglycan/LPS O-acetylase OafA/YrhL